MKDSSFLVKQTVFSPSSCLLLCKNRINFKAILFTLQKYVTETKIRRLLCMQHKEQIILHYFINYGKLVSHLCILVFPIHFKCVHEYTQHMYPQTYIYVQVCVYVQQLKELYCKLKITKCTVCLKQKVSPIWKIVQLLIFVRVGSVFLKSLPFQPCVMCILHVADINC